MMLARLFAAAAFAAALPFAAEAAESGGSSGHGAGSGNRIVANFTMPSDLEPDAPEPAEAGEGEGDGHGGGGHDEGEAAGTVAGPRVVDIPTVTVPSFVDGELRGYFFVSVRLLVAEGVDAWKIRDKAHLIRDALIRAGHRRSIADPEQPARVDMELGRAILRDGLADVVPLAEIERLEIVNVDSPAS